MTKKLFISFILPAILMGAFMPSVLVDFDNHSFNITDSVLANDIPTINKVDLKASQVPNVIRGVANWLGGIALALAIFFAILAGIFYMIGGNKPDMIKKAHQQLLFAAIGIVVVLIAQGIEVIIETLLKSGKDFGPSVNSPNP